MLITFSSALKLHGMRPVPAPGELPHAVLLQEADAAGVL
jgi:hypothetical protein